MSNMFMNNYALSAILLNPAVVLHGINTFASYLIPNDLPPTNSMHPYIEKLGPVSGSKPYLDMHENDQLCWRYTFVMIIVQLFAYGKVASNRRKMKEAKAAESKVATSERENIKEWWDGPKPNGAAVGSAAMEKKVALLEDAEVVGLPWVPQSVVAEPEDELKSENKPNSQDNSKSVMEPTTVDKLGSEKNNSVPEDKPKTEDTSKPESNNSKPEETLKPRDKPKSEEPISRTRPNGVHSRSSLNPAAIPVRTTSMKHVGSGPRQFVV